MKRFLIKTFWFGLPFLFLITVPSVISYNYSENFCEIDNIVNNKKKYLIGYAHNEENYKYLKWKSITSNKKKDILA